MREIAGDICSAKILELADAICVTTNGVVKGSKRAVMGAGCAKDMNEKFEGLDYELGEAILKNGHITQIISTRVIVFKKFKKSIFIVSFPTKHVYWEKSDLVLIETSTQQLVELAGGNPQWKRIILPRPGCQHGRLDWTIDVKPLLKEHLDDKFYIISRG